MLPVLLVSDDKKSCLKYISSNFLKAGDLFFEMTPEGTKYLISQIKEVIRQTFVFNPKKRIYFFPDFHLSSIEAQNAFLKGLEETPDNVLFILTTDSVAKLLPTVISRIKIVKLEKKNDFRINAEIQKQLEEVLAKKNFNRFELGSFEVKNKEEGSAVLNQIVYFFRGLLPRDVGAGSVLKEVVKQRSLLENNNLTPQLAVDHVLIFISKIYKIKL